MIRITTNIPAVRGNIEKIPARIGKALSVAIMKSAFLVERYSKMRSPVDTGRMRSSIFSEIRPQQATVMPNVKYAIYVHNGTRFMKGRPFMKQGLRDSESEIRAVFNREIMGALR